ncbi:hypothetical protein NNJEOMEG_00574 [Fundidesulfovibrio magnetotacticus]|uniref:Methyltransferase type 11 domain-containing protein n=1 Tax=Fundidesulfovibrio magnetotacticus TaxID=2730080 RepID=A0A6V8LSZ8_9BACT|nr:class I SAM-dependent methyltransferase [Fundidesulfovibrio magnetotacticus]GFK92747.1 hypothetical protein NNJEOMEG_00574 [Fundidesulfovibrio magnetotacticus]
MENASPQSGPRLILHVGCGTRDPEKLPPDYRPPAWREIRLDINPAAEPDFVGDIREMPVIADGSVDAVFSSHNLEHLHAHEVPLALREFYRVLAPGGHALVTCPDLQQVARLIVEGRILEPVFSPPAGPVTPLDMVYGYRPSLARGNQHMAHRTGFTPDTLKSLLEEAGFTNVRTTTRPEPFLDIWAMGIKPA